MTSCKQMPIKTNSIINNGTPSGNPNDYFKTFNVISFMCQNREFFVLDILCYCIASNEIGAK